MGLCEQCFQEKGDSKNCPSCGYDPSKNEKKYPLALKPGTILNGRYIVGRVLGQGGFGITYLALDDKTKRRIAVKEYYPSEFAGRERDSYSVQSYSGDREEYFEYGKIQFLEEAKTLAEFIGDEHIVRVYSYFEENNTAYFTMEYVEGSSLEKYMVQLGGRLSVEETASLLLPLMDSLEHVHEKGIVHRDVSPDNILIENNESAKLIDFGAARHSTGEKSKSLDVVVKHGFAPKEQYTRHGRQGPYTDVYAMAATFYYAITGKVLPESVDRMEEDELIAPSTLGVRMNRRAEEVLFKALEVSYRDRYQTMTEFCHDLRQALGSEFITNGQGKEKPSQKEKERIVKEEAVLNNRQQNAERNGKETKKQKQKTGLIALAAVVIIGVAAVVGKLVLSKPAAQFSAKETEVTDASSPVPSPAPTQATTSTPLPAMSLTPTPSPIATLAPSPDPILSSSAIIADRGTCGDNCTWILNQDGVLTVSGTGAMNDFNIGALLFENEKAQEVKQIVVRDGITRIGNFAFWNCSAAQSITIPKSVSEIGNKAFDACYRLQEFSVSSENEDFCAIDGVLFSKDQTKLIRYPVAKNASQYTLPNDVTSIGEGAFCYSALTEIHLSPRLHTIGKEAFSSCRNLASVVIPSGVEKIEMFTFDTCTNLRVLYIPRSIKSIDCTFINCNNLTDINYEGSNQQWQEIDFGPLVRDRLKSVLIHYNA